MDVADRMFNWRASHLGCEFVRWYVFLEADLRNSVFKDAKEKAAFVQSRLCGAGMEPEIFEEDDSYDETIKEIVEFCISETDIPKQRSQLEFLTQREGETFNDFYQRLSDKFFLCYGMLYDDDDEEEENENNKALTRMRINYLIKGVTDPDISDCILYDYLLKGKYPNLMELITIGNWCDSKRKSERKF